MTESNPEAKQVLQNFFNRVQQDKEIEQERVREVYLKQQEKAKERDPNSPLGKLYAELDEAFKS